MLNMVKLALRIVSSEFDSEIKDIIAAAKADLISAGIVFKCTDPLIKRAVIIYAKAHFGFSDDSEKYAQSYASIKSLLALVKTGSAL